MAVSNKSSKRPELAVKTTSPRRSGAAGGLVQAMAGGGAGSTQLALEVISPNPHNPKARMEGGEDLDSLTASVADIGVVQPVTVVSRSAWVDAHGAEGVPDGADWVLLAGHRRLRAAELAGLREVPGFVRDDLAAEDASVLLAENGRRLDLNPFEEGDAYRRLLANGRTQTAVAKALGVSQAHVSKRAAIAAFPQELRAPFLEPDGWEISTAYEAFHDLDDEELQEATVILAADAEAFQYYYNGASNLARLARKAVALRRNRAALVKEGVDETMISEERPAYSQVLRTKKAIAKAKKEGTLVVHPSVIDGDPPTYSTSGAVEEQLPYRSPYGEEEARKAAARKAATKGRWSAVVAAGKAKPTAKESKEAVYHLALRSHADHLVWLRGSKIATEAAMYSGPREHMAFRECAIPRDRLVWILWLASVDQSLSNGWTPSLDQMEQFFEALQSKGGYTLTDYDRDLLAGAKKQERS